MTLLDDSVAQALLAARIVGKRNSYSSDNPVESRAVLGYLRGGSRPATVATAMGKHLVALEDARRLPDVPSFPPAISTGCHWPDVADYPQLAANGFSFAVVTAYDVAAAKAKLDAAKAAGLRLIIGAYPEPYTYANGSWTISAAGVSFLQYLASREAEIVGLFVFNEPYWVNGYSAQQLRDLRAKIKTVWPNAKVYHDIGQPSRWTATGDIGNGRTQWDDQTGVADLVGIWDYPFEVGGYQKTRASQALATETAFVTSSMAATPVWLGQSHAAVSVGLVYPTDPQISDWNTTIRAGLPSGSLLSWYVWRQDIYSDYLANHPTQWKLATA